MENTQMHDEHVARFSVFFPFAFRWPRDINKNDENKKKTVRVLVSPVG